MDRDIFDQFETETAFSTETAEWYHRRGYWGDLSCCEYLDLHADERGQRTAVVDDSTALTWSELQEQVDAVAAGLQAHGVEKGDPVVFRLPHVAEWFVVRLGISRAGGISVPLYPRFQEQEITHVVEAVEPKIYIGQGGSDRSELDLATSLREDVNSLDNVFAVDDAPDGVKPFEELVDEGTELADVRIDPDYPETLSLSSGTTGLPKIYYMVQNSYLCGAKDLVGRYCITEYDDIFAFTPVQQAFGHLVSLFVPLVSGAAIRLTNTSDPSEQWNLIQEYQPTFVVAIPTQTTKMLNVAAETEDDLSFVRTFINGGAPLPTETAERVEERGTTVVNDYGAGDGGLSNAGCPADTPETRFTTVGTPQMSMRTLVVDEDGNELPTGEAGEVIMTGGGCNFGYFEDKERTEEVFDIDGPREGWFHTNDAGIIDEQGNLTVVGRMDDMILRGGQNVYPAEIEDTLLEIDGIAEAAVIGVPDPELGERVGAYVVPASDVDLSLEQITSEFEQQGIAKFKWPEHLELIEELPRSPGGKIQKSELQEDIEGKLREEGEI